MSNETGPPVESVSMQELWDRVTGTQPDPPGWIVAVTGLVALALVLHQPAWRILRNLVTIAHEGGHALVALLCGRRLTGIRLHSDTSGVTVSVGKPTGLGMVLTAAAGYPAPALLGLGAAALLAGDHITLVLWLTLAFLLLMLVAIRNLYGVFSLVVSAGVVFAVSWLTNAKVQAGFAYLLVWFLLAAGIRPVVELQRMRRKRRAEWSDADQLADLTRIPGAVWVGFFALANAAALGVGAGWLAADL